MKKTGIHIQAHVSNDNKITLYYYLNNHLMFYYDPKTGEAEKVVKLPAYAEMGEYANVTVAGLFAPTKTEAYDVFKTLEDKGKALYAEKSIKRLEERMKKLQNIQEQYGEKIVVSKDFTL